MQIKIHNEEFDFLIKINTLILFLLNHSQLTISMMPETKKNSEADKKINEADVWHEFKCGSQGAYSHIYQENVQALYDYGMYVRADNELIKDCIQELFIHIWQRRNNLGDVKNIRTYLMAGLRRRIIDQSNANKSTISFTLEKLKGVSIFALSHENNLIDGEASIQRENDLLYAIEKLPPRQKEVVYLTFYKKFHHDKIAEIMSINVASVYTLTWKAIKALKKQLKYISILLPPILYLLNNLYAA